MGESVISCFSLLGYAIAFGLMIFWMVVAWRAMKALEGIAESMGYVEDHVQELKRREDKGSAQT